MKKNYRIDIDCIGCAEKLESVAKSVRGVKNCVINFMAGKMNIEFEIGYDVEKVMNDVYKNCKKIESDCEIYLN